MGLTVFQAKAAELKSSVSLSWTVSTIISSVKPVSAVLALSRGNHKERALQYNDHETKGTFVDMTVMGWQGIREDLGLEI